MLISAELPLSYYVFSAARNNTTLTVGVEGEAGLVVERQITIPDGNYTTQAMSIALRISMEAAFAGATFSAIFDPTTLKFTVRCSRPFYIDTQGARAWTEWGLGYYLGLPRGVRVSAPANGTVTGTRVASLNPENYLLVHVEHMNDIGQTGTGRKAFAKVPLNGDSYQFQYYDKTLSFVDIRPPLQALSALQVSIRFHDGTPVDLNGGEWSMSMEFVCTHAQPV